MTAPLWPSLPLLDEACDRIFLQRFGQVAWIPATKAGEFKPEKDVTDIVLVGRLHEEILEHNNWAGENFRLWAMGTAGRDVRINVNRMHPDHISFLDRYEMFPLIKVPRPFPQAGERWSLVYSGRIKEDKGFGFFLKVASAMQVLFGENVLPVIFGVLDSSKSTESAAENLRLKKLLGSLPWTIRPEMWTGLPQGEWLKVQVTQPVLFNFSVFLNDDFGVSAAQAQCEGWPLLLSDWGGHRDIRGKNIRRFPVLRRDVLDDQFDVSTFTGEILSSMRRNLPVEKRQDNFVPAVIGRTELEAYAEIMRSKGVSPGKPWGTELDRLTEESFRGKGYF